jgi:hypothetical protein
VYTVSDCNTHGVLTKLLRGLQTMVRGEETQERKRGRVIGVWKCNTPRVRWRSALDRKSTVSCFIRSPAHQFFSSYPRPLFAAPSSVCSQLRFQSLVPLLISLVPLIQSFIQCLVSDPPASNPVSSSNSNPGADPVGFAENIDNADTAAYKPRIRPPVHAH